MIEMINDTINFFEIKTLMHIVSIRMLSVTQYHAAYLRNCLGFIVYQY